ncbi:MAG: SpoIIE family protein phosphatase [Candidatus Omnitrophica bacterium]|nr:SpoIIE family protein phosphatase [Candidatus Omnitrophota bacterium]MDD4013059.1 SpoIIE family protein phosphatase [Candidatus Omnitrophota bacterium]
MINPFSNRTLAFKLSFFILTGCMSIFTVIFTYDYHISRDIIARKIEESARNLTLGTVSGIESVIRPVEKGPSYAAQILDEGHIAKEEIVHLIKSMLENYPEIYGATAAFEPYALDSRSYYSAPYFYRDGDTIAYTDLGTEDYDYFGWEWYKVPKDLGGPVWSEPYFDKGGGNVLMATYSVPFYRDMDGKTMFTGIVTADISLEWLEKIVSSIRISSTGYAFLVSRKGTIVTHPDERLILKGNLSSALEVPGKEDLGRILSGTANEDLGFGSVVDRHTNTECWAAYASVPTTGWTLVILFPKEELMRDIVGLSRAVFALGGLGILLLFAVIVMVSGSITGPLRLLAKKTGDIARGNFDIELPVSTGGGEVGSLTEAFIHMRDSLKRYIEELKKTTAEKEKINVELRVAHNIQMGILPKVFPPFPERTEFDIYATLVPAKEVGGDLYDLYFLDRDHICFVIGDVSGKGVPAALFMAMAKTSIKINAKGSLSPGEILSKANLDICSSNDLEMFVTVFLGILDTRTGEVVYANAGHNPPILIRRGKASVYLGTNGGPAVGMFEETSYHDERLVLPPGDALYLYTDGVTEAMDADSRMFSEERLLEGVEDHKGLDARGMVESVVRLVSSFTGNVDRSDDITVLVIRYLGRMGEGGPKTYSA